MDNVIQLVGRLHPLIVHLPIGVLALALVLHVFMRRGKYQAYRGLLPLIWLIAFISSLAACIAGYLLSISGGYAASAVDIHMWSGIALAVFCGIFFLMLRKDLPAGFEFGGVGIVALLLLATGHYGGTLTHGEDYLTQPVYALLGIEGEQAPEREPITNIQEAVVYRDLVAPILEQKCYKCHGARKQKGKLRLDTREWLLKGGENGEVILAGNAEESSLFSRLKLPVAHDEHMPPKGKPQLTKNEVKLIGWWLADVQASFTGKVADVKEDGSIKAVLASFTAAGAKAERESKEPTEIPAVKVSKVNPEVKQQLEELGVTFTFLTPDHTFLGANIVNNKKFNDEQVELLVALKDQLVWLDLSETKITDQGLSKIVKLKHLTRLSLDNTGITDEGVKYLKNLPALRYLNLYGTRISDEGLKSLSACKNLKGLYLWKTQVTLKGVAKLQDDLGSDVEVNFGS